jgi:hypothetical protein
MIDAKGQGHGSPGAPSGSDLSCDTPWGKPAKARERRSSDHRHRGNGQILSSLATFVVAAGILYQGREAPRARDDQEHPQIIVDADYTGRFTTNIVVRSIGNGAAKDVSFEFSAPLQSTEG